MDALLAVTRTAPRGRARVPRVRQQQGILSEPSASFQAAGAYLCVAGPGGIGPSRQRRPQRSGLPRLDSSGALAGQPRRRGGPAGSVQGRIGSGRAGQYAGTGRRWWRCRTIRAAARARCLKNLVPRLVAQTAMMASPARPRSMPSRTCPLIKPLRATLAPASPTLATALREAMALRGRTPATAASPARGTALPPDTARPVRVPDTAPARLRITARPATPPRLATRAATARQAATTRSQERVRGAEGPC